MRKAIRKLTFAAALTLGAAISLPASAQDAQTTYRDIEQTLGSVPGFFKLFPESGIAGAPLPEQCSRVSQNSHLE